MDCVTGNLAERTICIESMWRAYKLSQNNARRRPICHSSDFFNHISYRRETALKGGLVMAKSGRLELGDKLRTL